MARHADALFLGHDGAAEGNPAPAAGESAVEAAADLRVPVEAMALSREDDLPPAGAALPLGAAGRGVADNPARRHRRDHGALRSRDISVADSEIPGESQPACADDVQSDAEASRGRA